MSINAGFHRLKVAEVRRETADAVSVRFEIPEELKSIFAFKAGQHLTLRTELQGKDVRRNYSVCVAPSENEIRIAIKQMPAGTFSSWANSALQEGHMLDVLPPMGRFVAPEARANAYYVGLAGGSGITPVISILKTVLETQPAARFVLLYGNRATATVMFLEELAGLKNRYMERLEIYHFLEDEAEEIELFNGRLNRSKCEEIFESLIDVGAADAFFICGPGPMMDGAEAALLERGVAPNRILIERFTSSTLSAEQLADREALERKAAGTELIVTLDGRRSRVAFDPAKRNILDCVQAAGLPAPYACKGGVCTTCRAKILEGQVTMVKNYGLTEQEVADGYVLTCQSVPATEQVVLSYDE